MNTLTIDVASRTDHMAALVHAMETRTPQRPRHTFENAATLMRSLGGKRFDLIQVLSGTGPVTIREAARRAGRDVKAVHSDVQILLSCGVLDKTSDGKIVLPYDAVKVEFVLQPIAQRQVLPRNQPAAFTFKRQACSSGSV